MTLVSIPANSFDSVPYAETNCVLRSLLEWCYESKQSWSLFGTHNVVCNVIGGGYRRSQVSMYEELLLQIVRR